MPDLVLADAPPLCAALLRSLTATHVYGSGGKPVTHPPGGLRRFPFAVIVHAQEGGFRSDIPREGRVDLGPGDCLVVPADVPHTFGGAPSGRLSYAHAQWSVFAGLDLLALIRPPRRVRGQAAQAIGAALVELHADPAPPPADLGGQLVHHLRQRTRLDRLLLAILAASGPPAAALARLAEHERLRPALELIARMRDPPPTRGELAAAVGLSPSRLSALFVRVLGRSPVAHRNALRMQKAEELLLTSAAAVSTIAERLGYRSLFHFSRQFRRDHGCCPSLYRERGRQSALPEGDAR